MKLMGRILGRGPDPVHTAYVLVRLVRVDDTVVSRGIGIYSERTPTTTGLGTVYAELHRETGATFQEAKGKAAAWIVSRLPGVRLAS